MKVLITGAGGFLGSHICDLLLDENIEVINLSRSNHPYLTRKSIKSFFGNITDPEICLKATVSVDAIIHTASKIGMWGKWDDFYQTNVIGLENLLKAAQINNVKKFVYTSTPSVAFGGVSLENVSEDIGYAPIFFNHYSKSKAQAEQLLRSYNSLNFSTVALRPHLIFGPRDTNLIPRLIERAEKKRLKIIGSGQNLVDVTYVKNAALAHVMALKKLTPESPLAGNAYFLGQEKPVFLWSFINQILLKKNISPIKSRIPYFLAYFIGAVSELTYKILGIYDREPLMTRFLAMQLAKSHYFDHHNSINQIGNYLKYSLDDSLNSMEE
jgi:nucleoside-diphosphate-sugar epimerase